MKALLFLCLTTLPFVSAFADDLDPAKKTRVIATSDNEQDDRNSMVRFLTYSNEFNVRGIIYSASKFHSTSNNSWDGSWQFQSMVEAYRQVYPNLIKHSSTYPTPDYLASRVKVGNIAVNNITDVTDGANLIRDVLLEPDTSAVWVSCWGGSNTIAAALKQIESNYPTRKAEVTKKLRLYLLDIQDDTWDNYIKPQWPGLFVVHNSGQFVIIGYGGGLMPEPYKTYLDNPFMAKIYDNHGELLASRSLGTGPWYVGEGDNPSWFHQIPVGLRNIDNPSWGGWGGRYDRPNQTGTYWKDVSDDGDISKPQYRWMIHIQNDYLARADWCVKEYAAANHPPVVKLAHSEDLWARQKETVNLSAVGTTDPDNNALSYNWWIYKDPSSYKGTVSIAAPGSQTTTLTMPADISTGQTIHVICEVTDNGTPPLTRYRRVVISCGTTVAVTPAIAAQVHTASSVRTSGGFVQFTSPASGKVRLTILSPDGRTVATTSVIVSTGDNRIQWDALHNIKPGMHLIRTQGCGTDSWTIAFVGHHRQP